MMQTRCPACGTSFQVTPEQMRLKGGKVRCGHCRVVFNALAYLMVKVTPEAQQASVSPNTAAHDVAQSLSPVPPASVNSPPPAIVAPLRPAREVAQVDVSDFAPTPPLSPSSAKESAKVEKPESIKPPSTPIEESQPIPSVSQAILPSTIAPPTHSAHAHTKTKDRAKDKDKERSKEKRTKKSAEHSKTSPRLSSRMADPIDQVAGASRWPSHEDLITREQAPWLQTTFLLLLILGLAIQLAYHFRIEVVSQFPETRAIYTYFNIPVGLPKNVDLVSIDASDLQADPNTKQLVLQAVLANRATYPQAWPALELSLTDTEDKILARRILYPRDYQRDKSTDPIFPARQEFSIRLHLDGETITPAGYHLYVFYP